MLIFCFKDGLLFFYVHGCLFIELKRGHRCERRLYVWLSVNQSNAPVIPITLLYPLFLCLSVSVSLSISTFPFPHPFLCLNVCGWFMICIKNHWQFFYNSYLLYASFSPFRFFFAVFLHCITFTFCLKVCLTSELFTHNSICRCWKNLLRKYRRQ